MAQADGVYLLCLPSHTTHILQPLDVGVFKSFKTNFSKACSTYLATNPGRVVTTDKLALLVAEAWPSSFTPVNIMSFKKCGVFPLNPSEVSDRQTAPSKTFCQQNCKTGTALTESENPLFSPEKEALFRKRYREGYDIVNPGYNAWLRINHPEVSSVNDSTSSSLKTHCSKESCKSQATSTDLLSDILVLPCPAEWTCM